MSTQNKNLAIVVGGGPAPGINGVISAVTIDAINRGLRVYGIEGGLTCLFDNPAFSELTINRVSRIAKLGGSILKTSRKPPPSLEKVVEFLKEKNIGYLVTIGGDGTLTIARNLQVVAGNQFLIGHVPKTIDNDIPLPDRHVSFGFETAREIGSGIVSTLLNDAHMTDRWYLAIAMGRTAGHLSLGIGISSGSNLNSNT